ncbi:hypothetical protein V1264_008745 [Littorina saxatilis]|uniref:Paraneoplastic antigen Ma-like C-terminal domain-containing protein n=1 Tax=Littorina saxatilis TaxID=31220 RepID=A0AAN9G3Z1_9CAEN
MSEAELVQEREAMREAEMEDLRHRLAEVTDELTRQRKQPVTVHVTTPHQTQRLKVFTGFAPNGGNECTFQAWVQQIESLLLTPDVQPCDPRILASLRGVALNAVKAAKTNADILANLRCLFGCVEDTEARLISLACRKLKAKEQPADFLLQLWEELLDINKTASMTDEELQKKLYRIFCTGLQPSLPLLALELRNNFGFPGTAAPALTDVLLTVRRTTETLHGQKPVTVQSSAQHVTPDPIDYDKLAEMVASKLRVDRPTGRRPRGPCWQCGLLDDHFARDCQNPPNPGKVASEKAKIAPRAAYSLNGNQSTRGGRR